MSWNLKELVQKITEIYLIKTGHKFGIKNFQGRKISNYLFYKIQENFSNMAMSSL